MSQLSHEHFCICLHASGSAAAVPPPTFALSSISNGLELTSTLLNRADDRVVFPMPWGRA
eukprot:841030-Pelagomonas_calceolata.AAC.2